MKPILFSTPMVKALLAGNKTMTRRIVKREGEDFDHNWIIAPAKDSPGHFTFRCGTQYSIPYFKCPYGKVGDILWVRETWRKYCRVDEFGYTKFDDVIIEFAADGHESIYLVDGDGAHTYNKDGTEKYVPWRPSIFMPKDICRLYLKITGIRIERLQDIREADAVAEGGTFTDNGVCDSWPQHITKEQAAPVGGLKAGWSHVGETDPGLCLRSARSSFHNLWEKINGPESWQVNPWVWVVSFDKIDNPINQI